MLTITVTGGRRFSDQFISEFETGYYPRGASKKTSGERIEVQGRPAYRSTGSLRMRDHEIGRAGTIIMDSGNLYLVSASMMDGDPLEDPEVRASLESFHFLSATSSAGQLGRLLFFLLFGAGVCWGGRKVLSKRRFAARTKTPAESSSGNN